MDLEIPSLIFCHLDLFKMVKITKEFQYCFINCARYHLNMFLSDVKAPLIFPCVKEALYVAQITQGKIAEGTRRR